MKKNMIATMVALVISAPAVLAAPAEIAPITVYSAYATPVNQDKTALSITVLTEKDFVARNATNVSDVLKTVPSVSMIAYGGRNATTSFSLRGAEQNHTSVIIDGVKVNPVTGLGFNFGGLSLSNIDRIEVLRGEQSALWGSDAMGGVIYITTKSGLYKDKPFNVDFDLGAGSHKTYDGSATISGYLNGFYYSLHGDSHRSRGISAMSSETFNYTTTAGVPFTSGGKKEKDKFHRDNVSARLGYDDSNKGIELLVGQSSQTEYMDPDNKEDDSLWNDHSRVRENVAKLSGYIGNDNDLFKQRYQINQLKTENYTNNTYGISSVDTKRVNATYQLDVNFDREGATTQAVSMLIEGQRTEFNSTEIKSGEKVLKEKSLAAEYRLFNEGDHNLSLSGRYTDNSKYENVFTGRVSGAYRLSPNFRTHASFGTAVQNPNIYDYYGFSGNYIANSNLQPEKSLGGDLGVVIETADKAYSLDVTYFARNVDNFITSKTVYCRSTYDCDRQSINLDGTTKVKGVELAYTGKFTDNLTGYANYTYTNTKDSKNQTLFRRAKHTANAGLNYQITEDWGSNINIAYVGKRMDEYWDVNYQQYPVKLPSYTLVNLGVNYQLTKQLNVYANLNNLFDKKYEHTVGYGQDGRNVYVGLKGSF